MIYYIDLFCGAGGFTTGANNVYKVRVIACVNHDELAIKSHEENHPDCKHFTEDIRHLNLVQLVQMVRDIRANDPNAIIALHASLECIHFSKAKGGQSRDPDSRTLANDLIASPHPDDLNLPKRKQRIVPRYIPLLEPDIITIENVEEFLSWGPLDKKGNPIKHLKGTYYNRWRKKICRRYGYTYDYRLLNAADFGAFTSRKRYFAQFVKPGITIAWPDPTHAKKPEKVQHLYSHKIEKWNAVKEVLDLDDHGPSMFVPGRISSDNTWGRVLAGLIKFVAGGKDAFLVKWNSYQKNGNYNPPSVDEPCPTVTTQNRLGVAQPEFLINYHGKSTANSVEYPSPTIATKDKIAFLKTYHGNGDNVRNLEQPSPTIPTKDSVYLVQPSQFIQRDFSSGGGQHNDINGPAGALCVVPKMNLMSPVQFVYRDFGTATNQSIDNPAGALLVNNPHMQLMTTTPFLVSHNGGSGQAFPLCNPCRTVTTVDTKALIIPMPWLMNHSYDNTGSSTDQPSPTLLANRKHYYLMNPQWGGHHSSIDKPMFTLIARMDKAPPYLIEVEGGRVAIKIEPDDTPNKRKVKEFMAIYGLIDIKMRMLNIQELKRIQGFPESYKLAGNQTHQKKFLGNAVEVNCATAICLAIAEANLQQNQMTA